MACGMLFYLPEDMEPKTTPTRTRCRKSCVAVLLCGVLILAGTCNMPIAQKTIYFVDPTGDGSDGLSWRKAFRTVQEAISAATTSESAEIWVAAGIYTNGEADSTDPVVVLEQAVDLYGGFSGYAGGAGMQEASRESRDWDIYPTVFDGNSGSMNACHVIVAADQSTIDGIVIRNGKTKNDFINSWTTDNVGGGLYLAIGFSTVRNCLFEKNVGMLGQLTLWGFVNH